MATSQTTKTLRKWLTHGVQSKPLSKPAKRCQRWARSRWSQVAHGSVVVSRLVTFLELFCEEGNQPPQGISQEHMCLLSSMAILGLIKFLSHFPGVVNFLDSPPPLLEAWPIPKREHPGGNVLGC